MQTIEFDDTLKVDTKERTDRYKRQCNKLESINVILPYEKSGEFFVEDLGEVKDKLLYAFLKRSFDIIGSLIGLIVLAIPMLIVAVAIKCTSPGSVFYKQERVGKNGRKFNIIKFRTMVENAEEDGAQWSTSKNDARVTKVGKILRYYHLDEIPQFTCILSGHMSFVGPRPERECFYQEFEKYIHGFSERLKVKPGLTGLAQNKRDFKMKPEEKIEYDIQYIKNRSFWYDIKIIFRTLYVIVLKIEHQ